MRKLWPFAVAVIVIGGLTGLAIAGRPTPGDPFVLDPTTTTVIADTLPTSDAASTTVKSSPPATPPPATSTATTSPPTSSPVTTTTITGPLPRNRVRLVIANGDGRFRLAITTADRLSALGYVTALAADGPAVAATLVYFHPGFADEAAIVATDLGVPNAPVAPVPTSPSQPITDSDDRGDVIVVLGPDAPR